MKKSLRGGFVVCASAAALVSCSSRVELPEPESAQQVDQFSSWAAERSQPYGIDQRALQSYAYAAWKVQQDSGCSIGWPTIAALGSVLSDHGQAQGSKIQADGTTTVALRDLGTALKPDQVVADTDGGDMDGRADRDVPIGPMQIMPSRWEQFAANTEDGKAPNPDDMDDAALTAAIMVCTGGDVSSPDGWDRGVTSVVEDMETVKQVHAKAKEYSR